MTTRKRKIALMPGRKDFQYGTIEPGQLPGVMRRHILTGTMGTIYGTLTTGLFLVAFGNVVHISVMQWGLLGAVSSFAIVFQVLSAFTAAQFGYRRLIWFISELISRLLRAAGFAVSFWLYLRGELEAAAAVVVALLCIASFFAAFAQPIWFSWLADIIPERIHGSFMGRRDAWISLGTISIVLPASYCIDLAPDDLKANVLTIIFGTGILLGLIDLFMHRQIPEPPAARFTDSTFWQQVMAPLRDREYRPWLVFTTCWNFSMMLGAALATVFFVNDLRIRDNYLGGSIVLIGVPLLATMLTSKWSGLLVDRLGVRRMVLVGYFCWAILPGIWIIAKPSTALFWLGLSSAIGGAGVSAAINAGNKFMTRVPPRKQRAMYLAVTACINNVAAGVASLIAGFVLAGLGDRHWTILGKEYIPFHLIFLLSCLLRLASWGLAFAVKKPRFDTVK
jgi:hypothetical protein